MSSSNFNKKNSINRGLKSALLDNMPPLLVAFALFQSCGVKKAPVSEAVVPVHSIESYFQKYESTKNADQKKKSKIEKQVLK